MAGLYIHIPFCESRCIYCGFYSTTSLAYRDAYIDALCREMELRPIHEALGVNAPITTIYLGGGTPSQLTDHQLTVLFDGIRQYIGKDDYDGMEITMECNPDDVTDAFCKTLSHLPVNRISMGAQTFSDERLRFLHRRHNTDEVKAAVHRLRNIGISNISIDLMFGFPDETLEDWEHDIHEAVLLNVEHVSAYSLMYEEGTLLYRLLKEGKIQEIDEELSLKMYQTLVHSLRNSGFEHYEISNFAKPGYRSRHNSSYWQEVPYVGLGAAAHSYHRKPVEGKEIEVIRSWNTANIQAYIHDINQGVRPFEQETLDLSTRYNDLITTALRTKEGIDLTKARTEYGNAYIDQLLIEARDKIRRGMMEVKDDHLALTEAGIYISDDIMSDFMIV